MRWRLRSIANGSLRSVRLPTTRCPRAVIFGAAAVIVAGVAVPSAVGLAAQADSAGPGEPVTVVFEGDLDGRVVTVQVGLFDLAGPVPETVIVEQGEAAQLGPFPVGSQLSIRVEVTGRPTYIECEGSLHSWFDDRFDRAAHLSRIENFAGDGAPDPIRCRLSDLAELAVAIEVEGSDLDRTRFGSELWSGSLAEGEAPIRVHAESGGVNLPTPWPTPGPGLHRFTGYECVPDIVDSGGPDPTVPLCTFRFERLTGFQVRVNRRILFVTESHGTSPTFPPGLFELLVQEMKSGSAPADPDDRVPSGPGLVESEVIELVSGAEATTLEVDTGSEFAHWSGRVECESEGSALPTGDWPPSVTIPPGNTADIECWAVELWAPRAVLSLTTDDPDAAGGFIILSSLGQSGPSHRAYVRGSGHQSSAVALTEASDYYIKPVNHGWDLAQTQCHNAVDWGPVATEVVETDEGPALWVAGIEHGEVIACELAVAKAQTLHVSAPDIVGSTAGDPVKVELDYQGETTTIGPGETASWSVPIRRDYGTLTSWSPPGLGPPELRCGGSLVRSSVEDTAVRWQRDEIWAAAEIADETPGASVHCSLEAGPAGWATVNLAVEWLAGSPRPPDDADLGLQFRFADRRDKPIVVAPGESVAVPVPSAGFRLIDAMAPGLRIGSVVCDPPTVAHQWVDLDELVTPALVGKLAPDQVAECLISVLNQPMAQVDLTVASALEGPVELQVSQSGWKTGDTAPRLIRTVGDGDTIRVNVGERTDSLQVWAVGEGAVAEPVECDPWVEQQWGLSVAGLRAGEPLRCTVTVIDSAAVMASEAAELDWLFDRSAMLTPDDLASLAVAGPLDAAPTVVPTSVSEELTPTPSAARPDDSAAAVTESSPTGSAAMIGVGALVAIALAGLWFTRGSRGGSSPDRTPEPVE